MKLSFMGATREVTGSKHLITTKKGLKILLDCGMYQGKGLETDAMNRDLGFDPAAIDYLILSHAHIDHSGLIPFIYKLGFRGTILCPPATRDLCAIMLADAGRIQEADVHTFNKKRKALGQDPVEPIYTEQEAQECMSLDGGTLLNDKVDGDPQHLPPGDSTITWTGTVSRLVVTPNWQFL